MKRYFYIFFKSFKFSLINQMQHKFNFLLMLPVNLVWTMEEIFITFIFYNYTNMMYGWQKEEFILLIGTYFIVDSLFTSVLLPNINDLSERIRTGNLDFFLLKPIDTQFLAMTHRVDVGLVYAFSIGVSVVAISLAQLDIGLPVYKLLLYILLVINGALCFASIVFILGSFAFKTIKIDYVDSIFLTFAQFCKKPFDIYPALVKKLMLYLVPLGFVSYVPSAFLLNKIGYVWLLSFAITPLLFWISRKIWLMSLRDYEGASA
ncbi:protein of unknown function DUF990 [Paenibacillus curdlanolyticus YK9]|uniref:ABC transporter permease protein n=1 Tax=Paenibacillus curdlanolyticus YK9 TaxID=717606 RepID=E0I7G0_9BACL|nr:ABC-2 family transporter protein [Paenibacillus curdlanolyticus]EFM11976.1 protein of unknown function DUF990 [Paenibacillus curdlanolyticus YK9]